MIVRFSILLVMLVLVSTLCSAIEKNRQFADSLEQKKRENTQKFYDSLQSKTTRRAVPRLLYNAMFLNAQRDTLKGDKVVDETVIYNPYTNKNIGSITIARGNVFENSSRQIETLSNKMHYLTRERVIKRDLLFKVGDQLDPEIIVKNQQILRYRSYISDAKIEIMPSQDDSTSVDVFIYTRDSWTISADVGLRFSGRTMLEVYDANILGTGNKLSIGTNFNWSNWDYGGGRIEYDIPNILGTFFRGNFIVGKAFENSDLGFIVRKDFIKPTDYEFGLSFLDKSAPVYMLSSDSTMGVQSRKSDIWAGYSRFIKKINSSIFLTARYSFGQYTERPDVDIYYNSAFHNYNQALIGIGLYQEKFYTANLIYGYGFKEYLASGYKAELVSGYSWGEFENNWYMGINYHMGGFCKIGYMMGGFSLGSYISPDNGRWNRSALDINIKYFTNLFTVGRSRIRQFVSLNYMQGWNRYDGANEAIEFTKESGPRGFEAHIIGMNRAVLNTETVVFTPLQPLGFRFAFFGFADFGLLGNNANVLKNNFYSTIGVGIRIKNERMVFNTIQLRLGVCLGKGGLINNEYFNISNQQRMSPYTYLPTRPEIINYE